MWFSIQDASFVGLFVESILFGILLVSTGICLGLLLFQPNRLVLKKRRDVKWCATCVVICMFVASALDVTLNFVNSMKAFIYTSGRQNVVNVLNVTRDWVGLTRYTLYIVQVLIADNVLFFRLFVIYGRRWTSKVVLLTLLAPIGMSGTIFLITFGIVKHDFLGDVPKFTEIGLFGVDLLFNAVATSLIVRKFWKTHNEVREISLDTDKWLLLIRIIVESGLLYMCTLVALAISDVIGNPAAFIADVVGQVNAIATVLIIIRTHDMLQNRMPRTYNLSQININLSVPSAEAEGVLAVDHIPGEVLLAS